MANLFRCGSNQNSNLVNVPTLYYNNASASFSSNIGDKYVISICRLNNFNPTGKEVNINGGDILFRSKWQSGNGYGEFYASCALLIIKATSETISISDIDSFSGIVVAKY